jgi:hypothetical protein
MGASEMKQRYPTLFIAAFIALLLLPLRTLVLDPHAIEESFYGRAQLVRLVANLRIWMGDRVFPKALVGNDGWLVFTGEGDLEDYQKTSTFSEEELERIQERLDALSAAYEQQGTTLILIVAPNKSSIYPEAVPGEIPVLGQESRLEQLTRYLGEHGRTRLIDLRPALLAAKQQHQVYYATDTHWNDYGAYIAYEAILAELQPVHPNLRAHPLTDFTVVETEAELQDLSNNIGTTLFPERRLRLAPNFDMHTSYRTVGVGGRNLTFSYNPDESLPTLVLYYDSFFFRVNPLLGEHFQRGVLIQNYIAGGLWTLSWVEEEKPDVVIIEFSERYLKNLLRFIEPD